MLIQVGNTLGYLTQGKAGSVAWGESWAELGPASAPPWSLSLPPLPGPLLLSSG